MARPLRIEFAGAWYHVMNRGASRRTIFQTRRHRSIFLKLLGDISTIYRIEIHAYCFMINHYHLLVHTPESGLGRAMRHLDGVYTQAFNRTMDSDGPLFRGRYRSVLVERDSHLCCVSRYIHLNPVEAGLASHPENYSGSSYRAYVGLVSGPSWLITKETLDRFGGAGARREYRRFVESGIDAETREFFSAPRLRPVLGNDAFRQAMAERARLIGAHTDVERPDGLSLQVRPGLDRIASAVCTAFKLSPTELRVSSPRSSGRSAARGAFVLLGRELGGCSLSEIASWVGYRSYAGASKAMGRLRTAMATSLRVREQVEVARRELTEAGRP